MVSTHRLIYKFKSIYILMSYLSILLRNKVKQRIFFWNIILANIFCISNKILSKKTDELKTRIGVYVKKKHKTSEKIKINWCVDYSGSVPPITGQYGEGLLTNTMHSTHAIIGFVFKDAFIHFQIYHPRSESYYRRAVRTVEPNEQHRHRVSESLTHFLFWCNKDWSPNMNAKPEQSTAHMNCIHTQTSLYFQMQCMATIYVHPNNWLSYAQWLTLKSDWILRKAHH